MPKNEMIQFERVTPILRIFDEAKAKEFYVGFLGFTVNWEHRFDENAPLYLSVSRAGFELHLSEHSGDCTPGGCVFVTMKGIEAFHQELTTKQYKYNRPGLEQTFYGAKCVEVIDPFGNKIRFNEYLATESQPT